MGTSDITTLEPIYTRLSEAKMLLHEKRLHESLGILAHLLQMAIHVKVAQENKNRLTNAVHEFLVQLEESTIFKETFGPVSFVKGNDMANLDFILSLIEVDDEEISAALEAGKRLLNEGKVDEARIKFKETLERKPYSSELRIEIGETYLNHELYADAEEILKRAQELNPESMHIFNRLGIALRKQGKYKEAIEEYRRALEVTPEDENLYFNMSFAYFKWGKVADAECCLKKALEINPDFVEGKKLFHAITQKGSGEGVP